MSLFELDIFGCATTAILALFSIVGALAYFGQHGASQRAELELEAPGDQPSSDGQRLTIC
ncbi:MAG: hypothetical protein JSS20_09465 [Proteobacteria bacterium]|nr:hypothetical protein [Pseudomonadota bacterium]